MKRREFITLLGGASNEVAIETVELTGEGITTNPNDCSR
jgi:hypothetical protein